MGSVNLWIKSIPRCLHFRLEKAETRFHRGSPRIKKLYRPGLAHDRFRPAQCPTLVKSQG